MKRRNVLDAVEKIIRRKILSIPLIASLVFLMMLSAVPASAAVRSTHHSIRINPATPTASCYYVPNSQNCDGQDPKDNYYFPIKKNYPQCAPISTILGGDPWYLQVDYAINSYNNCESNWGTAYAPNNEYVQVVSLSTQDGRSLYYCTSAAIPGPCHSVHVQAVIPNGYQSYYTDMLWAPNTKVQLCEIWSPYIGSLKNSNSQCSILH